MNTLVTLSALFAVAFSCTALVPFKTTALSIITNDGIAENLTTIYPHINSVTKSHKRPTKYSALLINAPSPLIVLVTKMSRVSFVSMSDRLCPAIFDSTVKTAALPVSTANVSLPREHGKWAKRRLIGREQLTKQRKRMTSLAHEIARHMNRLIIVFLLEFALVYGVGSIVEKIYPNLTGPAHIFPAPLEDVSSTSMIPHFGGAKTGNPELMMSSIDLEKFERILRDEFKASHWQHYNNRKRMSCICYLGGRRYGHWILLTYFGNTKSKKVVLLDSQIRPIEDYSKNIYLDEFQMKLQHIQEKIVFNLENAFEQQNDGDSCGWRVAAAAVLLASKKDPVKYSYDSTKVRDVLKKMIDKNGEGGLKYWTKKLLGAMTPRKNKSELIPMLKVTERYEARKIETVVKNKEAEEILAMIMLTRSPAAAGSANIQSSVIIANNHLVMYLLFLETLIFVFNDNGSRHKVMEYLRGKMAYEVSGELHGAGQTFKKSQWETVYKQLAQDGFIVEAANGGWMASKAGNMLLQQKTPILNDFLDNLPTTLKTDSTGYRFKTVIEDETPIMDWENNVRPQKFFLDVVATLAGTQINYEVDKNNNCHPSVNFQCLPSHRLRGTLKHKTKIRRTYSAMTDNEKEHAEDALIYDMCAAGIFSSTLINEVITNAVQEEGTKDMAYLIRYAAGIVLEASHLHPKHPYIRMNFGTFWASLRTMIEESEGFAALDEAKRNAVKHLLRDAPQDERTNRS